MRHRLALLWSWWVRLTLGWLPDLPACMRWRGFLYGLAMPECGADFQVAADARIVGLDRLRVGRSVYLAPGSVVLAADDVHLEDEVMLAYRALVTDGDHTARDGSYRFGPRRNAPVRIGAGTWVGAHVTVVSGTRIGRGVLVAANSVVSGVVEDGYVVGGVPARPLRGPQSPEVV